MHLCTFELLVWHCLLPVLNNVTGLNLAGSAVQEDGIVRATNSALQQGQFKGVAIDVTH